MQHAQLDLNQDFQVSIGNQGAQAAVMTLQPHESTGGPGNRHRGSDQWLFVVSGEGSAIVNGQTHLLRPGTLLLIENGENHEIRCQGEQPLKTLNLYAPPAYAKDGKPLPSGQS